MSRAPNRDPVAVGFDTIPDLPFAQERSLRHPVMRARIGRYDGRGFRTLCGWIQIVTDEYLDAAGRAHSGS